MQTFDGSRRLFGRAGPQLRCSFMLILAVRRQFLNSERVSRRFVDRCVSRRILAASVRRRRVTVEGGGLRRRVRRQGQTVWDVRGGSGVGKRRASVCMKSVPWRVRRTRLTSWRRPDKIGHATNGKTVRGSPVREVRGGEGANPEPASTGAPGSPEIEPLRLSMHNCICMVY